MILKSLGNMIAEITTEENRPNIFDWHYRRNSHTVPALVTTSIKLQSNLL
jgi:hypothetical protein